MVKNNVLGSFVKSVNQNGIKDISSGFFDIPKKEVPVYLHFLVHGYNRNSWRLTTLTLIRSKAVMIFLNCISDSNLSQAYFAHVVEIETIMIWSSFTSCISHNFFCGLQKSLLNGFFKIIYTGNISEIDFLAFFIYSFLSW